MYRALIVVRDSICYQYNYRYIGVHADSKKYTEWYEIDHTHIFNEQANDT